MYDLQELKEAETYKKSIENYTICLENKMPLPSGAIPFEFLFGTDFQRKVWNELLNVEHGHVATYGDIAKRIGKPTAARSVGRACGSNNLALLVPCHRIVGSNRKLTGYKWSCKLKEQLLNNEKENSLSLSRLQLDKGFQEKNIRNSYVYVVNCSSYTSMLQYGWRW